MPAAVTISNDDIRRELTRRPRQGTPQWPTPADIPDRHDLRDPDYTDADRALNEQRRREIEAEHDVISEAGAALYDEAVQDEDVIWKCRRDDWYVLVGERCSLCGRGRAHATRQDDDDGLW